MKVVIPMSRHDAPEELEKLRASLSRARVDRVVGTSITRLVQGHLNHLPPNKNGWPSTGFYRGAARGTGWDSSPNGVVIYIDNEAAPGAMRQRYNGGTIKAKDKLLTIPARAEFYGHRAGEFDNLKFVRFKSGVAALVVSKGGTGRVNFQTGRQRSISGVGVRSEAVVAYWLKDSVDQDADPDVLPTDQQMADTAVGSVAEFLEGGGR
jgi:hypothetical protein